MVKIYNSDVITNQLNVVEKIEKGCWISAISPSQDEIDYLIKVIGVAPEFIHASLDEEETSHIDQNEEEILLEKLSKNDLFLFNDNYVAVGKDYQRINFNYGNTIAFDFDVEVAGEYQMIMSYYDNSTPEKMSVTVNGVTQNVPKRIAGDGYNTGVKRECCV